jgi:hypothetical protein
MFFLILLAALALWAAVVAVLVVVRDGYAPRPTDDDLAPADRAQPLPYFYAR